MHTYTGRAVRNLTCCVHFNLQSCRNSDGGTVSSMRWVGAAVVGRPVLLADGLSLGGCDSGSCDGAPDGDSVGRAVGGTLGRADGDGVGGDVGMCDGGVEGCGVGLCEGNALGLVSHDSRASAVAGHAAPPKAALSIT